MDSETRRELVSILQRMVDGDLKHVTRDTTHLQPHIVEKLNRLCQKLNPIAPVMSSCLHDIPVMEKSLEEIVSITEDSVVHLMSSSEQLLDRFNSVKDLLERTVASESDYGIHFQKIEELNQQNQDEIYDMMSSLEFQDITHQKVDRLSKLVGDMQTRVDELAAVLSLRKSHGAAPQLLKREEETSADDQGLVDKLLAEFGL